MLVQREESFELFDFLVSKKSKMSTIRLANAPALPTDSNDHSLIEFTESEIETHPASLICDLCRNFYKLGWVTGTGGGISIRNG